MGLRLNGDFVQRLMAEKKLNNADMARAMRITRQKVWSHLNGENIYPKTAAGYAKWLGVPVGEIVFFTEDSDA